MIEKTIAKELKAGFRGELLLPDDSKYDEARSVWNGMIDRRPAVIAQCLGVEDVIRSVKFAREQGLPLSIKSGGHNISGLAVCNDGLMIDMSRMRGVWVNRDERVAIAQAGCILGDVDHETQVHGLAAVLGFVSETGIAGLTLGGGFGYLTRRFGWTSDNLLSVQLVTAEGRVVQASKRENGDLFWALRGGGGNFGVATGFEYKLYPIGPDILAGAIAWRAEHSEKVLDLYRDLTAEAPQELVCVAVQRIAPPAPWLTEDVHGEPIIAIFVCYTGEMEDGEKLIAPLRAIGSPVGDIIQRRPYVSQQSLLDATQPKGRRYYWKSEYLPSLEQKMVERTIKHANRILSPFAAILLFPLGGALNQHPEDHSAVGNRETKWVVNIAASWEKVEEDEKNIEWTREAWRDIRQFSTGGTYINFLTEEEGDDRIHAAYGKNYNRLVEVKTNWDPENMFRMNKNIEPRTK
jgi:FAD/FMN-containing dehydrogenase